MPVARNGRIDLRYQSVGEGPVVMLHHGGGFELERWELAGWVDSLTADFRVVSFDARGNGESDKPTDPDDSRLDPLVGDVLAVADAMAQMWHMPEWASEQQRHNDPEAVLVYLHSSWPELSHVPDQLRVPRC